MLSGGAGSAWSESREEERVRVGTQLVCPIPLHFHLSGQAERRARRSSRYVSTIPWPSMFQQPLFRPLVLASNLEHSLFIKET
jgi:hypothetical protein